MKVIISGKQTPTIVAKRIGWSRTLGDYNETVYEGYRDSIISLGGQLRGNSDEYTIDGEGAKRRLTVRQSLDENPDSDELTTEVRLYRNRITKSIFENPAFDDVPLTERKIIKKAIDTNDDSEIDQIATAHGIVLYELLLDNVEGTLASQPMLTITTTASGKYGFTSPTNQPGLIYSTAAVLPATLGLIDASLLPNQTSGDPNKGYGWFYWGPEIVSTTGGRKQMVLEFEYGLWDNTAYTFAAVA